MTNGEMPGIDTATLEGRVMRLEGLHIAGEQEKSLLNKNIELLTFEVQRICQAIGISYKIPIREDWEEITQVRRPELAKLKSSRRRSKLIAVGSGFATGLFEVVRYVLEHYQGHWH